MGCPSEVIIGQNAVVSICTHNPDTAALADADVAPSYKVYEEETGTAILTGTMSKPDAGSTGFYTATIACTSGNGFENQKVYSIYITARVAGITGGISFSMKAWDGDFATNEKTSLNTLVVDAILTGTVDGAADVVTALKYILAYCSGEINRINAAYTYRNFDNDGNVMTLNTPDNYTRTRT